MAEERLIGGVLGGLAGALAFGVLTGATTVDRWLVIVILGAVLAAIFSQLPWVKRRARTLRAAIGLGMAWGVLWWLPGLLFHSWQSIIGYAAWGALVGIFYDIARRVALASERSPV